MVNYRSDGHPITTANSWHLHRNFNSEARFVTEVHADIVATGSVDEANDDGPAKTTDMEDATRADAVTITKRTT